VWNGRSGAPSGSREFPLDHL